MKGYKIDRKIIIVANNKGGVGKTTTAETMGYILAQNKRVLLIDLDSQANLTTNNIAKYNKTIYDAITTEKSTLPIYHIAENLDIVPSDARLATIEFAITNRRKKEYILRCLVYRERRNYDYIIIDCAPSFSFLTVSAIVAAQLVVIPVTAEGMPIKGLANFLCSVKNIRDACNRNLQISGVLITRYSRKRINNALIKSLRETFGNGVFDTVIRYNVSISEAAIKSQNITKYEPDANGTADYIDFVNEFMRRTEFEQYLNINTL